MGRIRILAVDIITPEQLTEADAIADSFDCLADLMPALERYCSGPQRDGRDLYRVKFEFVG